MRHIKHEQEDIEDFEAAIAGWVWDSELEPDDQEMIELHAADRADLTKILNLFIRGEYKAAGEMACDLDTIVRDQIPAVPWDMMMEEL